MRKEKCLFSGLIASLALALDLEENRKLFHAWRVALVSWLMAKVFLPKGAGKIFYGALLHDIGAMGIDDHIIHSVLSGKIEVPEVLKHCEKGAAIVKNIPSLAQVSDLIMQHHERWDGMGFPRRLKANEINPGAQIIATADLFDITLRRTGSNTSLENLLGRMRPLSKQYFSNEMFILLSEVIDNQLFRQIRFDQGMEEIMKKIIWEVPSPGKEINDAMPTTSALAAVIDAKHSYTAGHSERVALYALNIGAEMGLGADDMIKLQRAGLLHDLGKIGVPRAVLDKQGKLSADEFEIIKKHPQGTIDILATVKIFEDIAYSAGGHHERFDGKGYPLGLAGKEIPLMGRILAVADAFDAMTSKRPYQPTRSHKEAFAILKKNAGKQFDKEIVEAAIAGLKKIEQVK